MEFANQICERAKKFDGNILGEGIQKVSNSAEESCKVYCKSKSGKTITKSWIFPDGTTCRNQDSDLDDSFYCVNGRCEVKLHSLHVYLIQKNNNNFIYFFEIEIYL